MRPWLVGCSLWRPRSLRCCWWPRRRCGCGAIRSKRRWMGRFAWTAAITGHMCHRSQVIWGTTRAFWMVRLTATPGKPPGGVTSEMAGASKSLDSLSLRTHDSAGEGGGGFTLADPLLGIRRSLRGAPVAVGDSRQAPKNEMATRDSGPVHRMWLQPEGERQWDLSGMRRCHPAGDFDVTRALLTLVSVSSHLRGLTSAVSCLGVPGN